MRVRHAVAVVAWLGAGTLAGPARAAPDPEPAGVVSAAGEPPPRGRVELRGGLGLRDDQLDAGGARISTEGGAVSELVAGGAWFAPEGPFGAAARLELERFAVSSDEGQSARLLGLDLGAGATGRWTRGRVQLEGMLGYGYLQIAMARQRGAMPLAASPLQAHGPVVAGTLAVAAAAGLTLEAAARLMPITFGGEQDGASLPPRRVAVSGGACLALLEGAGLRWSGLLLYELARTTADGTASLRQTRQQISFGLRGTFLAPRPPAPAPAVIAPVARGRVRGIVRAAPVIDGEPPGPPLGSVSVTAPGRPPVLTDAQGAFNLEGLAPGLVRLRLGGAGLLPSEEVVSIAEGEGEARLEATLRSAAAAVPAVLSGIVRDDGGRVVAARARIVERALEMTADEHGQFRFELPAGRYTLVIEAAGFVAQTKVVRAAPGEQNIYNVDLQRDR
jgi:hypothetical protein